MSCVDPKRSSLTESESTEPTATDGTLVRKIRGGNEDAARSLYLRYARRLLMVARNKSSRELATRVDAEEIVQSVFRTFFRRASDGGYDVPPGEDLWKLLLVIALNKVRKAGEFHRAAKRDVRLTVGSNAVDLSQQVNMSKDQMAYAHLEMVVEEVLGKLGPQHRRMFEMRIEGFEVAEIAAETQRSKRTVERILKECRSQLSATLKEDE